jgi:hypothetical protein
MALIRSKEVRLLEDGLQQPKTTITLKEVLEIRTVLKRSGVKSIQLEIDPETKIVEIKEIPAGGKSRETLSLVLSAAGLLASLIALLLQVLLML